MEVVVTTGAISHAKLQSNRHHQHLAFYRPDALPVVQPTVSKHWRKNITFHGLAYPKLTWGLPTLSLTTNSSLSWGLGEGCHVSHKLISSLMPLPQWQACICCCCVSATRDCCCCVSGVWNCCSSAERWRKVLVLTLNVLCWCWILETFNELNLRSVASLISMCSCCLILIVPRTQPVNLACNWVLNCSSPSSRPWVCRWRTTNVTRGQFDARPMVTFSAARHHCPLAGTKLYCLVTEAQAC